MAGTPAQYLFLEVMFSQVHDMRGMKYEGGSNSPTPSSNTYRLVVSKHMKASDHQGTFEAKLSIVSICLITTLYMELHRYASLRRLS